MAHELVVHCKRTKHDVYIGRPGPYGNPFILGQHGNRDECGKLYKNWLYEPAQAGLREKMKKELPGKVLGCWCAPNLCHGDIIQELLND